MKASKRFFITYILGVVIGDSFWGRLFYSNVLDGKNLASFFSTIPGYFFLIFPFILLICFFYSFMGKHFPPRKNGWSA
jgi:hypothetical protein